MSEHQNCNGDDGPVTSRSERPRSMSPEAAERGADAFIGRIVESAAGAWREASAASSGVAQLRIDINAKLGDVAIAFDRMGLRYAQVNDGQHALGRAIDHLTTELRGGMLGVAQSYERQRAELAALRADVTTLANRASAAETTGRFTLESLTERAERWDGIAEKAVVGALEEPRERKREARKLAAAVVLVIATAAVGWLFGRAGNVDPPINAEKHQEQHP